ncbi:hypothetical protein RFI_06965, partial [Reticulomyxa filosa]
PWWFVIGLDFANVIEERTKSVDVRLRKTRSARKSPEEEEEEEQRGDNEKEGAATTTQPDEIEDIDGIRITRSPMPVVGQNETAGGTLSAGANEGLPTPNADIVTPDGVNSVGAEPPKFMSSNVNISSNNTTTTTITPGGGGGGGGGREERGEQGSVLDRFTSVSVDYANVELEVKGGGGVGVGVGVGGSTSGAQGTSVEGRALPSMKKTDPYLSSTGIAMTTPGGPGMDDNEVIRRDTTMSQTNQVATDFHIAIRKFVLFNSIFTAIAITALILASFRGFYTIRGYLINIFVILLLLFGLLVGIRAQIWSYTKRLAYLQVYWVICFVLLFGFFIAAIVAVVRFVHMYHHICSDVKGCQSSTVALATIGGNFQ